jgi:hypothetical protein
VVVEDLLRGAPAHVVAVVAPAAVVGYEPGVGFGAELADGEKGRQGVDEGAGDVLATVEFLRDVKRLRP